ncbi:arylesterase [Aestuariivirga sp.]|uniref:arylesterase n=1 Tax=Aestuariivirga sp. TaxID=2650926 RepID=UPI0039E6A286
MLRLLTFFAATLLSVHVALAQPTILVLGDSLTAGLGLAPADAFPAKLEAALKAKRLDVKVVNAGVSGDTAADGLARLDWALDPATTAVIVELGANDALRGLPPQQMEAALDGILASLEQKKLPVLLAGMRAPRNLGPDYAALYDPVFTRLAEKHGALLYPFFLDGVAADPALNQADGMHPNPQGVDVIVSRILPATEQLLGKAVAK